MTLSEFVAISRSQSNHAVAGGSARFTCLPFVYPHSFIETQRLYWKDADCPPAWRQWLLKSGAIPEHILPGSTDDYLGYLSPSVSLGYPSLSH